MSQSRTIHISLIISILFPLIVSIYAQDSTFTVTESFRIYPPEGASSGFIKTFDINGNGITEVVCVFNYRDGSHRLLIYGNGESIHATDFEPGWECIDLFICDFNRNGQQDIIFEIQSDHVLEAYYGPNYELNLAEAYYYSQDFILQGSDRLLENGGTIPIIITGVSATCSYDDGDSSSLEYWRYGQVWQGTWLRGRPERVAKVCRPVSFNLRDNGQTGSDLFVAGYDYHGLEVQGDNNEYYTTYYQLFTSYGRDFSEPDSLVIFEGPTVDENDREIGWAFGFSKYSAVDDFDNDGELDWAQPYWEETGQDTYAVHLSVYNPDDLSLVGEYIEEVTDIFVNEMLGPAPVLGVAAIDVNNDDVWELLLAIQNRPLRVIDPRSMEVIMSSDFVLPDIRSFVFHIGRFDESNRLQLLIVNDASYMVFNFPEEWDAPVYHQVTEIEPPHKHTIFSAFPNPFNSTTSINYSLDIDADVTLSLFDLSGREVARLVDKPMTSGKYSVSWDASDLPSGIYMCRLSAGSNVKTAKLALVK
ncbi:MAG: T9SS type A sorting domain-containing protein [Candidatus Hatepunaea meridiana]|nr:T9SS type A sorting domain-containing protein [Candidatus Hatepunaea meridiana]